MKVLKWLYTLLSGHILLEARLKSIEGHITVLNGEMGDMAQAQVTQGKDLAYIRGRIDARP